MEGEKWKEKKCLKGWTNANLGLTFLSAFQQTLLCKYVQMHQIRQTLACYYLLGLKGNINILWKREKLPRKLNFQLMPLATGKLN